MNYDAMLLKRYTDEFGSPLYIFDEDEFKSNYKLFLDSFMSVYPKYRLAYSYKTNYAPYICRLVKEMGGCAEVVSDMEYYLAKKIGYNNKDIIYNGPYKGELAKEHIENGGILNIDSLNELDDIIEFSEKVSNNYIPIGIRVNIDIGQNFISRFGIDIDNGDFENALHMISKSKKLELIGLHCHIGRSRSLEAWENRTKEMLRISDKYIKKPLEYIDLGSGMFGRMEKSLSDQFDSNIPSFSDYAAAAAKPFAEHYKKYSIKEKPVLYTEPGTTIVNRYIDFISNVVAVKNIKGKKFAVLNASKHNIGEICTLKKLPVEIIPNKKNTEDIFDIVGYTCLEHDVMYNDYKGMLIKGDYVIFKNTGGYSNVSKPPFILPNCAMIAVKNNLSEVSLIKRRESYDDIFSTYI